MRITTSIPVIKYGVKSLTTSSIPIFAMLQDMNSVAPTGGVNKPKANAMSKTVAKCMGSIPISSTIGKKIGINMNKFGTKSPIIPAKNNIIFCIK